MAVGAKRLNPRCMGARILLTGTLSLFLCLRLGICQDLPRNNNDFAARRDFVELIIKTGEGTVAVEVCPSHSRMSLLSVEVTQSRLPQAKVKQEEWDAIFARELMKRQDCLVPRQQGESGVGSANRQVGTAHKGI